MKNLKTIPLKFLLLLFVVSGSSFGQINEDFFDTKSLHLSFNWHDTYADKAKFFNDMVQAKKNQAPNVSKSFKNDLLAVKIFIYPYDPNTQVESSQFYNQPKVHKTIFSFVAGTQTLDTGYTTATLPYSFIIAVYKGTNVNQASGSLTEYDRNYHNDSDPLVLTTYDMDLYHPDFVKGSWDLLDTFRPTILKVVTTSRQ
jgi:hypothetical protein